jgi:hypothetical protein
MSREPTERDYNELDRRLQLSIDAVEGERTAHPFFFVEAEASRVHMPHCVFDDPAQSPLLRLRYGITDDPSMPLRNRDTGDSSRDPRWQAIKLAVELTLPFTRVSVADDELHAREKWRAHTTSDVLNSTEDAVPLTAPARPVKPHHRSTANVLENLRFEKPLYPDGHQAWFEGWDQFLDTPFPEEIPA